MSPSPGSARNRSISSARPPDARRALPCTADSVVENTTLGSGLPGRGPPELRGVERWILVGCLPVQHRLVQPPSQQVDADPSYLVGNKAIDLLVGRLSRSS